jgi:hypothetical protein
MLKHVRLFSHLTLLLVLALMLHTASLPRAQL